ncbi:phosphotransferase [Anaerosporobacter faecicola]|uniref:phosphotransferase n=1 Tax=Anaerosporobacter faecicola TaxID=2718714 RepID=UPI001438813A|nr:phosphotransferase [Anaerosporobacter faecicola]
MKIIDFINMQYGMEVVSVEVLRDWIGKVFLVVTKEKKYIYKQFREKNNPYAIQSTWVQEQLMENKIPVPMIIPTVENQLYSIYENCVCILYAFVNGSELERGERLAELGNLCGKMRKCMERSRNTLAIHGREFFVDRYLKIIQKKKFGDELRFRQIADTLLRYLKDIPTGFIHGDFHAGNIFVKKDTLLVYDFDACANAYPVYDIATICDGTDYFSLDECNFTQGKTVTLNRMKTFLTGYEQYYTVSEAEQLAVLACIGIRHYDIQATIIETLGIDCIDQAFLSQQLQWLDHWCAVCKL